jgi:hypothetical protein
VFNILVSYLDLDYFDLLNFLGQAVRRSSKLFGGMVVVLSGDFMQLAGPGGESRFAFLSTSWQLAVQEGSLLMKNLTIMHRQKNPEFRSLLKELRFASLSPYSIECLRSRVNEDFKNDINNWTMW